MNNEEFRQTCYKCMRPATSCMCQYTYAHKTKTHFVILMHPMEYKHIKNGTGRLTHLQLKNSSIIDGINFSSHKKVNELIATKKCYLLYPGEEAINLSVEAPKSYECEENVIFILDATWPCAKKMLKLSDNLRKLDRLSFDNSNPSEFLIKQQPHPMCLSTIESVKLVIDELNKFCLETTNLDQFLLPFKKMIEYQIECTLRDDNKLYRANKRVVKKDKYKVNPQRNIILTRNSQID